MNLPSRVLVRASITATALCGATLLFSSSTASAAPADGLIPGVTLPPITVPALPPAPSLPVPLPTLPATPAPTIPSAPKPAVPATPTLPPVTVPAVPAVPGGSLPTPTLPPGTPTVPPQVTIPDIPGVDLELCASLSVAEQQLIDTCVKDETATATTVPAKPAGPTTPTKPTTGVKAATAEPAVSSSRSGGTGGGSSGGSLARTGSDVRIPVAIGAGLAALGGLALAASRLLPRFLPGALGRVFIQ